METKKTLMLSTEKARELYKNGSEDIKSLLLESFSKEELEQPKLPKTWEEYCESHYRRGYYLDRGSCIGSFTEFYYDIKLKPDIDKNVLNTKEDAEAHLALMQLHVLRDVYRDYYQKGWKPDWTSDKEYKYCVVFYKQKVQVTFQYGEHRFLSFPTEEIARQFLYNFKDLIEKAKDLI